MTKAQNALIIQRTQGACLRFEHLLVNRLSRQRIKVILVNRRGLLKDGLGLKFRRDQSPTLTRVLLRDVSADSSTLVEDEAVVRLQPRCHAMIRMPMTMDEIETHDIQNLAERLVHYIDSEGVRRRLNDRIRIFSEFGRGSR